MRRGWILFTGMFLLCYTSLYAQDLREDSLLIRKVAGNVLQKADFEFVGIKNHKTYHSADDIPEGVDVKISDPYGQWQYTNGVIDMAMVNLGRYWDEPDYTNFVKHHIAFSFENYPYFERRFDHNRSFYSYPFGQLFAMEELDNCGAMGATVIEIYQMEKQENYRAYIDKAAHHITKVQERLADGTLVRTFPHKMTLWGDDLYMSVPFLARMGDLTGDWKYYDDAIRQVLNFSTYLWDPREKLYYHAYYSDLQRNGVAHWGRANGWIMMAQVHLLDYLPSDHPLRFKIIENLRRQITGVAKYQSEHGLWHQVLDRSDSYEETSVSAMFVYCIAHAVNQGWIDPRYASIATAGWEGLKKYKITAGGDINDICVGTSIEDNLAFYYNRPAKQNDKHGIGSVIDAGIEIMKLKRKEAKQD